MLNKEEGLFHYLSWVAGRRKTPVLSHQGFFFVAECDEISNFELIKGRDKIIARFTPCH
jgi:hypothetical protein